MVHVYHGGTCVLVFQVVFEIIVRTRVYTYHYYLLLVRTNGTRVRYVHTCYTCVRTLPVPLVPWYTGVRTIWY
jgi:hypothetical protein